MIMVHPGRQAALPTGVSFLKLGVIIKLFVSFRIFLQYLGIFDALLSIFSNV